MRAAPKSFTVSRIGPGLSRLERPGPGGWSFNMIVVALRDGGLLLHGPTFAGEDTFAAVTALGEPRVLVAPNNYHHLHLARFRERFPGAIAVASRDALPRLGQKGHPDLQEIAAVEHLLPDGARFLRCEGTKSGEAWLSLPGDDGPTWIVCDAFFNLHGPLHGPTGLALRALRVGPGLQVSRTYRWLALADSRRYLYWALDTIAHERPRRLVVSHGEPLEADDLPERLGKALRRSLGQPD